MAHTHSETPMAQPQSDPGQRRRAQVVLLIGDVISFLLFAAIGRGSHGEATGFGALLEVGKTAAPFLLGWFLAAPWLGAFRVNASAHIGKLPLPRSLVGRTMLAWVVAWPLGLGLRALFLQRAIPLSFAIVTFIANTILLLGWRGIFAWLLARQPR